MCQLTIASLQDVSLNAKYLVLQTQVNSVLDHQDGCGYYSEKGLIKYINPASNLVGLGADIRKIATNGIMFGHVRKATMTAGVKVVDRKNSHPFKTNHLVLAHNGTLEFREQEKGKDERFKDMIDSEVFATVLSENYEKAGFTNFPKVLSETYKNDFYGKFAFLIHDLVENKYYCARGETALLHLFHFSGDINGYCINTEKISLDRALLFFNGQSTAIGKSFQLVDKDPVLLDQNSIYLLNTNNIEKVGEIVEEKRPFTATTTAHSGAVVKRSLGNGTPASVALLEFCDKFKISYQYLNLLFILIYNKGLAQSDYKITQSFISNFIPFAESQLYSAPVVKEWEKFKRVSGGVDYTLHTKFSIPFPYFWDKDVSTLRTIRKGLVADDSE